MTETTLTNARVVLDGEVVDGSVRIADGRIAEIGPADAPGTDLGGDFLLPGLVELHTDQVESHYQPRPRRFWDPLTAVISHDAQMAASGITTVLDALRIGSGPGDRTLPENAGTLIEAIVHAADEGLLRSDHLVHLRCEVATEDVIDTFDRVGANDRVRLVSLMDHTPGQRQYADVEAFRTYMRGKHRFTDDEFEAHVEELHRRSAAYSDVNRHEMARRAADRGLTVAAHDDATVTPSPRLVLPLILDKPIQVHNRLLCPLPQLLRLLVALVNPLQHTPALGQRLLEVLQEPVLPEDAVARRVLVAVHVEQLVERLDGLRRRRLRGATTRPSRGRRRCRGLGAAARGRAPAGPARRWTCDAERLEGVLLLLGALLGAPRHAPARRGRARRSAGAGLP